MINVAGGATFNVSTVSGGFDLLASQTLKGSGKIIGNLTVHGIHAPGDSPGIETVQGNYNVLGQLEIELAGTAPGTGYDQVLISGAGPYNATLAGTLALDWTGLGGSSDSTLLWILENDTAGTLSGAFGNYANGDLLGNYDGRNWLIWYGADAATGNLAGGNDVVIAAVPEPGVIFLLLSAGLAIGVGFFRRHDLKRGFRP
ncbi:MAG: PEP-CTERM sorting domain-containing protein [Thermoguttaceae bacterium]